jgi:gamma-glutamylaminecyclotransferase
MNLHPVNNLIFSYGTLKRGFPNHSIMEKIKASYISVASTKFKYPLVQAGDWNTPFLLDNKNYPNSYNVNGELFEIDKKGIAILDEFEGVGKCYYKRLKLDIYCKTEKGNTISKEAWCYFRYENSANLLMDFSKFQPNFGRKELKKYTAVHFRPLDWRNK